MQAGLEIFLQLAGGLPVLPHQRLEDGARAAALAMDQDLVGQLSEPVGDQPFELHTALRPSQPDRKVLHLAAARLWLDRFPADVP